MSIITVLNATTAIILTTTQMNAYHAMNQTQCAQNALVLSLKKQYVLDAQED